MIVIYRDGDGWLRVSQALLKTLPVVEGKAATDELASELVCRGGKSHRRLLVRALATTPPSRIDALPRYARLAAILSSCFRHVGTELTAIVLDNLE